MPASASTPFLTKLDRAPALPFLVPVVIESLASSRYKDRTCVVPGEADIYCASYVQQHGGIVLSTDLDLIVHDLGIGGAFSFFKGIRSSRCKRCKGACLFATKSLKPYQIAQQLGVSHVSRFAFELLRDPQVTLDDAIQRAQQPIQPKSDDKYERFRNTYPSFSNSPLPTTWDLSADLLDPRISEFIVQVESLSEKTIYYYLPVLLDDPIGSSAWVCGTDLRLFSYSVMLPRHTARNLQIEILEHQRCGEDVNAIRVELMDQTTCNAFAKRINSRIQSISRLQAGSMTAASWRVFGAVQVLLTYTEEQPNLPKGQILEQLLNELYKGDLQSWAGMCVYARLQAVLYSLRQVKQILGRLRDLTAPISELARELQSLPRLEVLIPGYDEISDSFDIGSIQQPVESAFGNLALTDSTLVTTKSKSKLVERGEELGTTEGKRKYASREGETDTRPVKMRW